MLILGGLIGVHHCTPWIIELNATLAGGFICGTFQVPHASCNIYRVEPSRCIHAWCYFGWSPIDVFFSTCLTFYTLWVALMMFQVCLSSEDYDVLFYGFRIWDLSLERDAEEEALYQAQLKQQQAEAPQDLPPQLLFVHQVLGLLKLSAFSFWRLLVKVFLITSCLFEVECLEALCTY